MATGSQNGGIFQHRLADRFPLSKGILVPNGMFVAFVVLPQYITIHALHTCIYPSIHTYIHCYFYCYLSYHICYRRMGEPCNHRASRNKHRKGQRCLAEHRFIHALIHEAEIVPHYKNFNRPAWPSTVHIDERIHADRRAAKVGWMSLTADSLAQCWLMAPISWAAACNPPLVSAR
jgi:hypothetical protein